MVLIPSKPEKKANTPPSPTLEGKHKSYRGILIFNTLLFIVIIGLILLVLLTINKANVELVGLNDKLDTVSQNLGGDTDNRFKQDTTIADELKEINDNLRNIKSQLRLNN